MPHQHANLCQQLKGKCVEYTTKHLFDDFKESQYGESFFGEDEQDNVIVGDEEKLENDWVVHLDSYVLFGETRNETPVLEVIRDKAKLSKEEKEILEEWQDKAFMSVFEILNIEDNKFHVLDVISEAKLDIHSNNPEPIPELFPNITTGQFIFSNLLSIKGDWFLSGGQRVSPASSERHIYENIVQKQHPLNTYRNNPEKLETAFNMQKDQYDFFVKYFGTDEVFTTGRELHDKQMEFYRAYNKSLGKELSKDFNIPEEADWDDEDDIGMVIDEKEGIHLFLDYQKFVSAFTLPPEDVKPSQRMKVLDYLEDETTPAFLFRKMKDKNPERFRAVINDLVDLSKEKKKFDPVDDFELLMDKYKPGWQEVYPSVHPINERFRKFLYKNMNVGRNDPCPCESGRKFKKCCES